jgi:hypothetical protein
MLPPNNKCSYHLVPSFIVGAVLGPFCAKFVDVSQWGGDSGNDTGDIAYVCF